MSDNMNLVEAFALIVEHYDTYTKQLGVATVKAFVNADAIKIIFEVFDDECTFEAFYKEEFKESFTVTYYELTDFITTIMQNVIVEHMNVSLEESLEECLSDYGFDGFMDLLTLDDVCIEIDNETIITFKFKDISTGDDASIIIPVDKESISRSNVVAAIHSC